MVYEVPASKKSLKQNRFEFDLPPVKGQPAHGKPEDDDYRPAIKALPKRRVSVPLMKFLKPVLVLEMDSQSPALAMKNLLDHEAPDVLARIEDLDQLQGLFQAWGEASGLDLGESEASPES